MNVELKYQDLDINEKTAYSKIEELNEIVKQIKTDCNELCSPNIWEGNLSNSFKAIIDKLNKYADTNILNAETTNSAKSIVQSKFIENENINANKYLG